MSGNIFSTDNLADMPDSVRKELDRTMPRRCRFDVSAMLLLISQAGRPLHRSEIVVAAYRKWGLSLSQRDITNIAHDGVRRGILERITRGRYWLKGKPIPGHEHNSQTPD